MEKTKEKCWCGKGLLRDGFNGRVDIACPDYFFRGGMAHEHIVRLPKSGV